MKTCAVTFGALLLTASSTSAVPLDILGAPHAPQSQLLQASVLAARADVNSSTNATSPAASCTLDQTAAPGNLSLCGNATLFSIWRSKARVIAPEGWMNDPMGMWQREDGSLHAGWQCHPQHIQWGNISMCAATSQDLVTFVDLNKTLAPSEIYDIRGVFDGTIVQNGFEGHPSILYTATTPNGPLGATVTEIEGVENQAIAYTQDGGESWTKLPFGAGGNPVIYEWPMQNLTGFRDPYLFNSARLAALLASTPSSNTTVTGLESFDAMPAVDSPSANATTTPSDLFTTISGGVRGQGSKLFLYHQLTEGDVIHWEYIGPVLETGLNQSWSKWSGNYGINFETAAANRLNASGDAFDAGEDETAVDFLSFGTEGARDAVHQNHWALWAAVEYKVTDSGTINSTILYSGVTDWGQSYAFVNFPYNGSRQISVGWTYEADPKLVVAKQMGYQGAFTTMRDLYVKYTRNVDPAANSGLYDAASWGVKNETDGSVTVSTLGQHIIPETLDAWKAAANVSAPNATSLESSSASYQPFEVQPTGRFYVLKGRFDFESNVTGVVGFRVLASDSEYTDILYDPVAENLTVVRESSSLVRSFDTETELAKLKLWRSLNSTVTTLNLTIVVDNSIIEVHANDEAVITTRTYPWLAHSTGAGLLAANLTGRSVFVSELELWDGLVNSWPSRPENSSTGLVWDGPFAAIQGLWTGI